MNDAIGLIEIQETAAAKREIAGVKKALQDSSGNAGSPGLALVQEPILNHCIALTQGKLK